MKTSKSLKKARLSGLQGQRSWSTTTTLFVRWYQCVHKYTVQTWYHFSPYWGIQLTDIIIYIPGVAYVWMITLMCLCWYAVFSICPFLYISGHHSISYRKLLFVSNYVQNGKNVTTVLVFLVGQTSIFRLKSVDSFF